MKGSKFPFDSFSLSNSLIAKTTLACWNKDIDREYLHPAIMTEVFAGGSNF